MDKKSAGTTKKTREEEGKEQKHDLKAMNWPLGDKMALCPSEPHFIFCSFRPGRKQSQVTDLVLITPGLPLFRKTKADGGHCTNCDSSLPGHVGGFGPGRIVAPLFYLSVKA